jgi:hypothetical protein
VRSGASLKLELATGLDTHADTIKYANVTCALKSCKALFVFALCVFVEMASSRAMKRVTFVHNATAIMTMTSNEYV